MIKNEEYYNSLDKRTKEYKEWRESQLPMEGLGDVVERITEATGIKKVVKAVFGDNCGCNERKDKLNQLFRFKVECLEPSEYEVLHEFFSGNPNQVKPSEYRALVPIASRIFNRKIDLNMGCGGCVRDVVNRLKKVYETYEKM